MEVLLARRVAKKKGKYNGIMSLICFSCEEIGHIVANYPNKEDKYDKKVNKFKGKKDLKSYKSYKDKGMKYFCIAKDFDINEDEDEIVYIDVKDGQIMRKMKTWHLFLMLTRMTHG